MCVVVSLRHKLLVIHQITTLVEETNHCRGEAEVHVLGIGQIFLLEVCPFTSIVRILSIFWWKDWRWSGFLEWGDEVSPAWWQMYMKVVPNIFQQSVACCERVLGWVFFGVFFGVQLVNRSVAGSSDEVGELLSNNLWTWDWAWLRAGNGEEMEVTEKRGPTHHWRSFGDKTFKELDYVYSWTMLARGAELNLCCCHNFYLSGLSSFLA